MDIEIVKEKMREVARTDHDKGFDVVSDFAMKHEINIVLEQPQPTALTLKGYKEQDFPPVKITFAPSLTEDQMCELFNSLCKI